MHALDTSVRAEMGQDQLSAEVDLLSRVIQVIGQTRADGDVDSRLGGLDAFEQMDLDNPAVIHVEGFAQGVLRDFEASVDVTT